MCTMVTQRGKRLVLLSLAIGAIATGVILSPVTAVSATATDSAVCDATDDPRQEECSNDNNDVVVNDDNANADSADNNDDDDDDECIDENEHCKDWSEHGECENNPDFMLHSCRRSCNVCNLEFADITDFGERQLIPSHPTRRASVQEVISKSVSYMQQHVLIDPKYNSVRKECRNNEENCSQWALGTGCDDNPKVRVIYLLCFNTSAQIIYKSDTRLECHSGAIGGGEHMFANVCDNCTMRWAEAKCTQHNLFPLAQGYK